MSEATRQIDEHEVALSSLEKLMFPDDGLTKEDVIDYYERIASVMLPHMAGRPLSMQRFPDGIDDFGFYQKEAPDYFPDWITTADVTVLESGEVQPQVVVQDAATLVYLANQGTVTPHIWLSRVPELENPDRVIFDLDPPENSMDFAPVLAAAGALRSALRKAGLVPFVMTTGSQGLHVVAPLDGTADFDAARAFARKLAGELADLYPEDFTIETRKAGRGERLFLDYLRNAYAQTSVAPYALRARPGAPVATPLDWNELGRPDLTSQTYNLENIFRRLGQKEDPWRDIQAEARRLPTP
jgi:bifunctional non-homologous end joining protein LigD